MINITAYYDTLAALHDIGWMLLKVQLPACLQGVPLASQGRFLLWPLKH